MGDPTIALTLITGVGDVDSALPSREMWKLSRLDPDSDEFRHAFDAFLAEYGSRGPNEWDLISDVWETKPELARSLIDVMRKQGPEGDPAGRSAAGRPSVRRSRARSVRRWRAIRRRWRSSMPVSRPRTRTWRVASGRRRTSSR